MPGSRLNLPNVITIGRIVVCPVIFMLAMSPSTASRFGAFVLFVVAALSDIWDGYLARKHGLITDMGKLLDPLADKLLMAVTLIPFYLLSHRGSPVDQVPWWGVLPLWVLVVIFGREILITLFRSYAVRKGVVIAAGRSGKRKALFQALFAGGLLLWYALVRVAAARGWEETQPWEAWTAIHGAWIGVTLSVALLLTVYSMLDYLWRYRNLLGLPS